MINGNNFNVSHAIKHMNIAVKNMFDNLNKRDINVEDKIIAFWPHISGLDMGYKIGIESSGLRYDFKTENIVTQLILNVLKDFDNKTLSAVHTWDKIAETIELTEDMAKRG